MIVKTKEELDILLNSCRAIPYSEIRDGGNFYKVKAQDFKFPDGTIQTREYIDKKRSSVVVPMTNDGNLIFVIQPISLSKEGSLIEFPAGYWEFNEDGKTAGIRELSEETGYVADDVIELGSYYQDPGGIRQEVSLYLALGCKKINDQKLDKGEFIKYVEVPYNLVFELMDLGYLKDANTFVAFIKSDRLLQKKCQNNISSVKTRKFKK